MNKTVILMAFLLGISPHSLGEMGEKDAPTKVHTGMNAPVDQQKEFTEDQFKPHMIDHFNEGCPTNSECSPKMGTLYKRWTELVESFGGKGYASKRLENFRMKNGAPVEVWVTEKGKASDDLIFWDSPCKNHNLEEQPKIRIGLGFAKNLNELSSLEKEEKLIFRFLRIYQGKGKPSKEIRTLRGDMPLYLDGEKLVFQKSIEGSYYGLSLDFSGKMEIIDPIKPPEFPNSLDCPKDFEEEIKEKTLTKNLYSGTYCQRTWNIKKNAFDILMVGWSCN